MSNLLFGHTSTEPCWLHSCFKPTQLVRETIGQCCISIPTLTYLSIRCNEDQESGDQRYS